ncbi:MAG: hypothetical protein ACJ8BW_34675 [Ktedonobacteraceae bacterium]|jgi:hypothetical protein
MKPLFGSDLFGSDPKEVIQEALGTSDFHGLFAPLDLTTIQFLKARHVPGYQLHYVAVQNTAGQQWRFTFFFIQKERVWCVKSLTGGPENVLDEPPELRDSPWIRLEMLFNSDESHAFDEFYAFGEVFDKGYQIERVRLLEQGKLVLEDSVQDGIVLFYSHQLPTIPPIQLELYNTSNIIASRQTQTLGSFPSVTKEV